MALKHGAEVLSMVPKYKNNVMCHRKNSVCQKSLTQAWVTVLLAMSSMLIYQQYTLNKAPFKEIYTYNKVMHWLIWECYDQRLIGTKPCISLRSNGPKFTNSLFKATYGIQLPWIIKIDCNFKCTERKLRVLVKILSSTNFLGSISTIFFLLHIIFSTGKIFKL